MQKFAWNESFLTGIKSIDVQHKELIIAVNDLADAIEQGKGPLAVKKLLIFLQYYAEWHFKHEEDCAEKHRCPAADANKQAHQRFAEIFTELSQEYRQNGESEEIARKMYDTLTDWLANHILKIDSQIGKCAKQEKLSTKV